MQHVKFHEIVSQVSKIKNLRVTDRETDWEIRREEEMKIVCEERPSRNPTLRVCFD